MKLTTVWQRWSQQPHRSCKEDP